MSLNYYGWLILLLIIIGCLIVFYSRRTKKSRITGSVLDIIQGESRYFKEIKNTALMSRLAAVGVLPGVEIKMISSGSRGPVVIAVRKTLLALGRDIAGQIQVTGDR